MKGDAMRPVLELGDSGADVTALQQALADHNFNPGAIDGTFGAGTVAAIAAFQNSEGLLADGVAGPRTQAALGLADSPALPDATVDMTVQVAAQMLPGAPLGNIKANLPIVLASLSKFDVGSRTMVLMAVATIRAETGGCAPLNEGISRFNTSPRGHPFDLYDFNKSLGNTGPPDGASFRGRGFVQLTGRNNYTTYGPLLPDKVDLLSNPELANDAHIAADLLSLFLAQRELNIKDALLHNNYMAARRLVNGGSNGLADFQQAYMTGDRLLPAAS
jgi:peptidoglycan L-alanyl-D-glutamate endopeptidase CwlK